MDFHYCKKTDRALRKALYTVYKKRCAYCNDDIKFKNMQVDHILATDYEKRDDDFDDYNKELQENGFISDSIENYLPTCPFCNISKNKYSFTTLNLMRFHDIARKNATKVIESMKKIKDTSDIQDYCPDFTGWRRVLFNNLHSSLSYALMGYHLGEQDVEICPRLNQIKEIEEKLSLVNYCFVYGSTGCGKSLTLYQLGYDYFKNGYEVYLLSDELNYDTLFPFIDEKPVLLIIDDAHKYEYSLLCNKLQALNNNVKVILGYTTLNNESIDSGVFIPSRDNLKNIFDCYTANKKDVYKIVNQLDSTVSNSKFGVSLEIRLNEAVKKATTPWQFNYILRGDWKNAWKLFENIADTDDKKNILAMISLLQIYLLDSSFSFDFLEKIYLEIYKKKINKKFLDELLKKNIILSIEDIKMIHLETAKSFLCSFIKYSLKNNRNIFIDNTKDVLDYLLKKDGFSGGFNWLYYSLFLMEYDLDEIIWRDFSDILFEPKTFKLINKKNEVCYFMSKVISPDRRKSKINYFIKNKAIIKKWIYEIDKSCSSGFSSLLNNIYNENKTVYSEFINELDLKKVINKLGCFDLNGDLLQYSFFINRLAIENNFTKNTLCALEKQINNLFLKLNEKNVDYLLYCLSDLYYLDSSFITNKLLNHFDVIIKYFEKNPEFCLSLFKVGELNRYIGFDPFYSYNPSNDQKNFCERFIKEMNFSVLNELYRNCNRNNWEPLFLLTQIVAQYNENKAMQLIKFVDVSTNAEVDDLWERNNFELWPVLEMMNVGNKESLNKLLESKKNIIKHYSSVLIELNPQFCIDLFKNGTEINLFEGSRYQVSINAIKALETIDKNMAELIIDSCIDQLAKEYKSMITKPTQYSNSITDDCYKLVDYIKNNYPNLFKQKLDFSI